MKYREVKINLIDLAKSLREEGLFYLSRNVTCFNDLREGESIYEVMEVTPQMLYFLNNDFGLECLEDRYYRQMMQRVYENYYFILKKYGVNNVQQIAFLSAVSETGEKLNTELYCFYGKISLDAYKLYNELFEKLGYYPIFESEDELIRNCYQILK